MKKILILITCLSSLLISYQAQAYVPQEGFLAGTLVRTPDGYKPIEELKIGDAIIGEDCIPKIVLEVSRMPITEYIKISLGNETICAALDQKLYLAQEGIWITAQDITASHWLLGSPDVYFPVHLIEKIDQETEVYAIGVQDHTFYVTHRHICAHNMCTATLPTITIGSIIAVNPVLATIGATIALATIGMAIYEKSNQTNSQANNSSNHLQERFYFEKRKQDLTRLKQEFVTIKQGLELITAAYRNNAHNFTYRFLHQLQIPDISRSSQPSASQELQLNAQQKEDLRELRELELEQLEDQIVDLQLSLIFHFSELISRTHQAQEKVNTQVIPTNNLVHFWNNNSHNLSQDAAINHQENLLLHEDLLDDLGLRNQELKFAITYYKIPSNAKIIKDTTNLMNILDDEEKNIKETEIYVGQQKKIIEENQQFNQRNLARHNIAVRNLTDNIKAKIKKEREQQKTQELKEAELRKAAIPTGPNDPKQDNENDFFKKLKARADKKARSIRFGKMYRDPITKLWWSKDRGDHGGSCYKVFKAGAKGFEWQFDADAFGKEVLEKHKGPVGTFIPYKEVIF